MVVLEEVAVDTLAAEVVEVVDILAAAVPSEVVGMLVVAAVDSHQGAA